ncbi:hypothetical protein ACSBR2_013228 [Camellia fascicularis]
MNMSRRRDHVSIRINEKLAGLCHTSSKHCICRVHDQLRRVNEKAYEPVIVAIGPYHHGKVDLQKMEKHKLQYLQHILKRGEETLVDNLVMAIRQLEEKARKCYAAETVRLDTDDFVEMMLLDGCFIVELFRKFNMRHLVEEDDLIFQSDQIRFCLRRDLILLENQLPFFIIAQLFDMTKFPGPQDEIIHMAICFLNYIIPNKKLVAPARISVNDIKHLLDLLHNSWCSSFAESRRNLKVGQLFINSATDLRKSGVRFKKLDTSDVLHIQFINGVLQIPPLRIADYTESFLRNLIAYEQYLTSNKPRYVCDYISFMNCLINSSNDVQLLRSNGIIEDWVRDDAEVHTMWSNLNKFIMISSDGHFSYSEVSNDVNMHCGRRQNVWMASLWRNYLNSPWKLASVLAAIILLLLTALQTVFTVLSYVRQLKN